MKAQGWFHLSLATMLFSALFVCTTWSQSAPPPPDNLSPQDSAPSGQTNTDPPGRVARIQYMSGEVSMQPGGVNDWVAAAMNRPLTTSDRVWTDKNSKAELSLGGGYVRLNSETSLTFANVSDSTVQLQLDQGTVSLTVRNLNPGEIYEVDTPNAAFTIMKPGVYRFDVYPNENQTWATVRKGTLEATGRGNAVKIKSGYQARFSESTSLAHNMEGAPAPDAFDDWASIRDQRLDSSLSARYVAPGVIGYEDLDGYGYWRTIAPYGPVWTPTYVPAGWAPYRFGHWVWIAPWGWTWVDDAPWGFAPFHYGRWVYSGGYWGWAPGSYRYWRPYYAPALVAWIGGPGWGVGFGFGGFGGIGWGVTLGWFPLGWGEVYCPWYHGWYGRSLSPTYIRNVNVTNTSITNVTNLNNYYHNAVPTHYMNREVPGAVTAAPQSALVSGKAINRVSIAVPRGDVDKAQLIRTVDANPTHQAILGGQAPLNNAIPPRPAIPRQIVTRESPPQHPAMHSGTGNTKSVAANGGTHTVQPAPSAHAADTPENAPRPALAGGASLAKNAEPTASADAQLGRPAHNVPRPPRPVASNGAVSFLGDTPQHAVPRPPQSATEASKRTPASQAQVATSNAVHSATEPHSMPRPPASAEVQHAPAAASSHVESPPGYHSSAPTAATPHTQTAPSPAVHPSTPASHEGTQPSKGKADNPHVSYNVPRPPAGYEYRAVPAGAVANSRYGSGSYVHGDSYASQIGSYHSGSYADSGGSYASAPAYRSGGYASAPAYTYHVMSPQAYAAPSVHYSAPSVPHSPGGGATHYSSPSTGAVHSGASSRGH